MKLTRNEVLGIFGREIIQGREHPAISAEHIHREEACIFRHEICLDGFLRLGDEIDHMAHQRVAVVDSDGGELAHEFINAKFQHTAPDKLALLISITHSHEECGEVGPRVGFTALLQGLVTMEVDRSIRPLEHHAIVHGPAFGPVGIGDEQLEFPLAHLERLG